MAYVGDYSGSLLPPKLLGTYENELHPAVERLIADRPAVIVNVGAGEGYYAVGLARRLPHTQVLAFEANEHGRALLAQVARENRVADRITIGGFCHPADLARALGSADRPWLVIDVEGAEDHLLTPATVPELARTSILLEVHDFVDLTLGRRILDRFAATHDCEEIWSQPRTLGDLPWWLRGVALTPWSQRVVHAMDEQRPGRMRWFIFTPQP
jgi:hypothetical protein